MFSGSAMWIQQVSLGWLTYEITGSAATLGIVNGLRSFPLLLLGPFGGVAADRIEPKKLMLSTQTFLVVVSASFATIVLTGNAQVWNLVVFALLIGVSWSFNMPARQAVVPNLVPKNDLMNAIALNAAGFNISRVLGPSLAGLLIIWPGIAGNFYLQSLGYIGVVAMVWAMRIPPIPRASNTDSMLRNFLEGANLVWRHPTLRSQMAIALIPVLLAMPYVSLLPIFAKDVMKLGPDGFGLLSSAPGVGALIGTLTIASLGNVKQKGLLLFGALAGLGIFLILFTQTSNQWLGMLLLVFIGGFQMTYMATNQTLLQMASPAEYRGRVMGIYMLDQGLLPFGTMFAGLIADKWDAPTAVLLMGISVLLLSIMAFVLVPSIRRINI